MLSEGKTGLGFAVGIEPLPSYFASKHVQILATDLGINNDIAKSWANSNQNAGGNLENYSIKTYATTLISKNILAIEM